MAASSWRHLLAGTVVLAILIAGVAKLADLPAFVDALHTWRLIPRRLVAPLSMLVPTAEIAISALWLLGWRRLGWIAALALLLCVTTAYVAQTIYFGAPECGCFGAWMSAQARAESAWWIIARNMLLMLLLAASWGRWRHAGLGREVRPQHQTLVFPATARAFTLIELLIGTVMLAILIALLAPGLANSRDRARGVVSSANLRQHVAVFGAYSNDFRGVYPFVTDPRATQTVIRGGGQQVLAEFFDARLFWAIALADGFYDGQANHASFFAPTAKFGNVALYEYSSTCYSAPAFWNSSTRTGPDQWTPIRQADVLFPSAKGVLVSFAQTLTAPNFGDGISQDLLIEAGWADGSASSPPRRDFTRPYPGGEGSWRTPPSPYGEVVIHTLDGIRGRDLMRPR